MDTDRPARANGVQEEEKETAATTTTTEPADWRLRDTGGRRTACPGSDREFKRLAKCNREI